MVPHKVDSDWSAFKAGDKQAFSRIYHHHVTALLKYGYKIHHNRSLVEDCVQDLFIELWRTRTKLGDITSVKFYLFQAVRYKILRKITEESRVELLSLEKADGLSLLHVENDLVEFDLQSRQMSHLKDSINSLPARQKEAINLRFYNNFSNEEVAQIMGVNYKSACRFIYMAIKKLKINLKISAS
ncbi:MAG TPA: sigma-70 family RNA polymerase sigma factor [Chryseosolibacter sp.]|nr:sigma-70 family RNA polymerase sigma factor [Chryseosolibacter sp.]